MLGNIAITEVCVCVRLQYLNKIDFDFDGTTEMAMVGERTRTFMQNRSLIRAMKHFPDDWLLLFGQFHAQKDNTKAIFFRVRVFAIK